jgi:hypothetical protein
MENTIDNGRIAIHSVGFRCDASAQFRETRLIMPVVLDGTQVSPFALCRMCAGRMALPLLARMLVTLVLDAEEVGLPFRYAYDDLGLELGRCGHSVKAAAAVLRKAGLMSTARAGSTGAVTFSAGPFVMWATDVLRKSGLIDRQPTYRPEPQLTLVPPAIGLLDALVPKQGEAVSKNVKSVSKTPKDVSKTRKPRTQPECLAAKEKEPAADLVAAPAPLPGLVATGGGDATEFVEEPVDNSEEVAGTLRAAGRTAGRTADDEDEFSLGSDTAETDMGHGVKINPDI